MMKIVVVGGIGLGFVVSCNGVKITGWLRKRCSFFSISVFYDV